MKMTKKKFREILRPSDLLRTVIVSAKNLDRSVYYPIGNVIHYPKFDFQNRKVYWPFPKFEVCQVCDAGVVIAYILGKRPRSHQYFRKFSHKIRRQLIAIDFLRTGDLRRVFLTMYGTGYIEHCLREIQPPTHHYYNGWEQFDYHINDLERYANNLEDCGY